MGVNMYYVRDPIHGFIEISDWERYIINQPEFQRLRRVKQLSLSNMVYPATNHTRFEHSLGVMHIATQMFDNIVDREKSFLENELRYNDSSLQRERVVIRLASLLHDVGHPPFSHAAEELMPLKNGKKERYDHEDYSIAIIENKFREYIENDDYNRYNITVDEVCDLLSKKPASSKRMFWRKLIVGQLDADRADYLLRDSYHAGVNYGKYDLKRILRTLTVLKDLETDNLSIGVNKNGWHAAEGFILARYQMFTQVYFQHTRRAYDNHILEAMKLLLQLEYGQDTFLPPTEEKNIDEYLDWDDWKVCGMIKDKKAGNHGEIILTRKHYRCVYETNEVPSMDELKEFEIINSKLKDEIGFIDFAKNSWYKLGEDIPIVEEKNGEKHIKPLSQYSNIIANLVPNNQIRIYVPIENKRNIKNKINNIREDLQNDKRI